MTLLTEGKLRWASERIFERCPGVYQLGTRPITSEFCEASMAWCGKIRVGIVGDAAVSRYRLLDMIVRASDTGMKQATQ
jgi:hypothetical protein